MDASSESREVDPHFSTYLVDLERDHLNVGVADGEVASRFLQDCTMHFLKSFEKLQYLVVIHPGDVLFDHVQLHLHKEGIGLDTLDECGVDLS